MPNVVCLLESAYIIIDDHGIPRDRFAMLLSPRGSHLESGDSTALIARVVVDVAEAVAGCAALRIAHRDVTPHNILAHGGRGYLTDFSVAKVRYLPNVVSMLPALATVVLLPLALCSHSFVVCSPSSNEIARVGIAVR